MNTIESPRITVPLGNAAHRLAQQFAAGQTTPQKGKQVYLNTLAVEAVHSYLEWQQIESDLSQGDSWHPGLRSLFNVADLVLPGLGKLECRPLLPGETICSLPPEVTEGRIGYVVVQLDESLRAATVLGFVPTVAVERLPISQLQPLEELLDHLSQRMQRVATSQPVASGKTRVKLGQWFENLFEPGWQSLKPLLGPNPQIATYPEALAFGLRSIPVGEARAGGGRLIDLGLQLESQPVVLLVAITQEAEQEIGIQVQVHPVRGETYLPPDLRLGLLSESGETLQEVQSRSQDNYIQLKRFRGLPEECFNIQVALGEVNVTQTFVI